MSELFWSPKALDDLERLELFLAQINENAAKRIKCIIENYASRLELFPLIGKQSTDSEGFYDLFIPFGSSGYSLRYKFFKQSLYTTYQTLERIRI